MNSEYYNVLFNPANSDPDYREAMNCPHCGKEINVGTPLLNVAAVLNEVAQSIGHLRDGDTMRASTVERVARAAIAALRAVQSGEGRAVDKIAQPYWD